MVDDWVIKTMYATKRRRKNPKNDDQPNSHHHHQQQQQHHHAAAATAAAAAAVAAASASPHLAHAHAHQLSGLSHLDKKNATKDSYQATSCLPLLGKHSLSGGPGGTGSVAGGPLKSNPSKRHRERLNAELERLSSLLPFDDSVIAKLDKLSILRLAVSYLRMKGYFHAILHERQVLEHRLVSHIYHFPLDLAHMEGDACLQALNGFIFIVSCDGEVFSASQNVESYLGFHQSDILHQSVMELIHSEDREEFRKQLSWQNNLPPEYRDCTLTELMTPNDDNYNDGATLEICGRMQFLHGQSRSLRTAAHLAQLNGDFGESQASQPFVPKPPGRTAASQNKSSANSESENAACALPPLGLFAVCSPLGPLPSLDGAHRDLTFKTKHKLNLHIQSMDNRAKLLFHCSEDEKAPTRGYDLVHPDDLAYVARGHKEVLVTGSIGLLVYRWLSKKGTWIWLQSRIKLAYKNGTADHILAIHRQLSDQEGRELYTRRNSEYKLPFPLLEPETLLGDEEFTSDGGHSNLNVETPKETGSGFMGDFYQTPFLLSPPGHADEFGRSGQPQQQQTAQQPIQQTQSQNANNAYTSSQYSNAKRSSTDDSSKLQSGPKDYLNTSRKRKKESLSSRAPHARTSQAGANSSSIFPTADHILASQYFQHQYPTQFNAINQPSTRPNAGYATAGHYTTSLDNWPDYANATAPFPSSLFKEPTEEFVYNSNDYSSAWLAVVAAAASKYQTGSSDSSPSKEASATNFSSFETNYSLEQNSSFHNAYANNYPQTYCNGSMSKLHPMNALMDQSDLSTMQRLYGNMANCYPGMEQVGLTPSMQQQQQQQQPQQQHSSQNESSGAHNLSGSASSSESVTSGPELGLNQSSGSGHGHSEKSAVSNAGLSLHQTNVEALYQYSLTKLADQSGHDSFNDMGRSSENAIQIPVVRRSWSETANLREDTDTMLGQSSCYRPTLFS